MNMYLVAHWIIAASSLGTMAITVFNTVTIMRIRNSKPPPSMPLENDGLEAEEKVQA